MLLVAGIVELYIYMVGEAGLLLCGHAWQLYMIRIHAWLKHDATIDACQEMTWRLYIGGIEECGGPHTPSLALHEECEQGNMLTKRVESAMVAYMRLLENGGICHVAVEKGWLMKRLNLA